MNIIRTFAQDAHWYQRDGTPMHTVIGSTTGKARPTNVADARKLGLLPSVTAITRILDKPALVRWKMEQTVLATMTTPRLLNEADDAFVDRVLNLEKQHEAEADAAKQLGQDIHAAIQDHLAGERAPEPLQVYVNAAMGELDKFIPAMSKRKIFTEKVVVAKEYAGRVDLWAELLELLTVLDFKTCKHIPKNPYPENAMQLAAYAQAIQLETKFYHQVVAANIYISTTEPGKAATIFHDDLNAAFLGFEHCCAVWRWLNKI